MLTVTFEEAKAQFDSLVAAAYGGKEIIFAEPNKPLLKLAVIAPVSDEQPKTPQFGSGKGLITYMADDFDASLDDMKEYTE